jgi:hypothetical protein
MYSSKRRTYDLPSCIGLAWLGLAWLGLAWLGLYRMNDEEQERRGLQTTKALYANGNTNEAALPQ